MKTVLRLGVAEQYTRNMTMGQPTQQHTDVKIMLQLSELYLRRSSIEYQGQSESSTKGQSHATSYRFASQSIRTYGVLVEVILL